MDVSEEELQPLYDYVDEISLSRPKRNIARDFADGVLIAEVVHHEQPRLVELHNYSSANSIPQKMYNWSTLNQKVFKRHLGFVLAKAELEAICNCEVGAIERVLKLLRIKLEQYKQANPRGPEEHTGHQQGSPKQAALPKAERKAMQQPPSDASVTALVTISSNQKSKLNAEKSSGSAEQIIKELRDTNELLVLKEEKLEQLVQLKDAKIKTLTAKLREAGLA